MVEALPSRWRVHSFDALRRRVRRPCDDDFEILLCLEVQSHLFGKSGWPQRLRGLGFWGLGFGVWGFGFWDAALVLLCVRLERSRKTGGGGDGRVNPKS